MKVKQDEKAEEKKAAKAEAKKISKRDKKERQTREKRDKALTIQLEAERQDAGLRKLRRFGKRLAGDPRVAAFGNVVENFRKDRVEIKEKARLQSEASCSIFSNTLH